MNAHLLPIALLALAACMPPAPESSPMPLPPRPSVVTSEGTPDGTSLVPDPVRSAPQIPSARVVAPTDDFLQRITKKPFAISVSPENSPVQPEKFSGFHTGADAEYGDVTDDVEVRAIAAGVVVSSRTATGYGGVLVIRHQIDGEDVLVLYGHLRPSSMLDVGATVSVGARIAVLGTGFSAETSGERRHLHLSILRGTTVSLLGYVPKESSLSGWRDPVAFLRDHGVE